MISAFDVEKIKVLVFDVDDTVTRGTLAIKVNVFKKLFADNLNALQKAREVYEFTGKGDRYNIIAHVLNQSQENCRCNDLVQEYACKFEKLTQAAIRVNGIHRDDLEALIEFKNSFHGPVYLLSATPQDSVVGNIRYFESLYPEIAGMFSSVIGHPMDGKKAGELMDIASKHNLSIDKVVMIGDGGSDYNGAAGSGSQFIGIVSDEKSKKWEQESFPKVSSIAEIPKLLSL